MKRVLLLLVVSTVALGAPPMTQADAEKYARAKYFEFELKDVGTDWLAFVKNKEAKEKAQADEERKQESFPPRPTDDVGLRAVRVVQEEFTQVAKPREDEIRALAKTILEALAKGDLETVAADCTMYDATAKDRLELTRAYLKENKAKLQKAAKLFKPDASGFPITMFFEPPSPERGMTGQVRIAFGPKVPAPKGTPSDRFPETHQIELWWSGEVMPEANGPVNASPTSPRPKSRWRFYQVITPWSQRPLYLQ
ncbi:MAG: hypothetical protein JNM17_17595 [Archangium sp.]|nr:hypothetical protein [Archangium sp.]